MGVPVGLEAVVVVVVVVVAKVAESWLEDFAWEMDAVLDADPEDLTASVMVDAMTVVVEVGKLEV